MSEYAVILAGGKGERFWPLSTSRRPKQFLSLIGDRTLLAQAIDRLEGLIPPERIFVITNQELVEAAIAAAPALPRSQIIGEPVGRDTAAAVALGAALVKARDPAAAFCVLTADHVIGDLPLFQKTLREGLALAKRESVLVTIGIKPTHASTAYGYIEAGTGRGRSDGIPFAKALRFVEKPDATKARRYLSTRRYSWNSGMFIWSIPTLTEAFENYRPPLAALIDRLIPAIRKGRLNTVLAKEYPSLEKISIDYALMEKARNIVMAQGLFEWDDVGSWTALADHFPTDADRNVTVGRAAQVDSKGNIIYSRDHLTALVGIENAIVVQAPGVTLVCAREKAQEIKKLLAQLRNDPANNPVL